MVRSHAHSHRLHRRRRNGVTLLYAMIAMTALCAIVSLAVDFGHCQLARTELHRAADSAARYAVTGLADNTYTAKAIAAASDNTSDGAAVSITSGNVVKGNWDITKSPAFDPTRGPVNAVKITATKSIALPFARFVGISSKTVTAVSIANKGNEYAFVGLNKVVISGNGNTDSYDSSVGSYSAATARLNGDVMSNGSISISGNGIIKGDAHPGVSSSVYLSGGGTVTGSKTPITQAMSYPMPTLPATYNSVGAVNVTSAYPVAAGDYYCTSISIGTGAYLDCQGPVRVYCSGPVTIGGGTLKTYQNRPINFQLYMLNSASINLTGQANFYAQIYGPQSDFYQSGAADLYGSVIAKSLNFGGSWQGGVHLDESLTPGGSANNGGIKLVQ